MASLNLGKVGLLLRGDWDSDTDYAALDVVSHEGYAYAARVANKNVEPSAETAAYWQPLAESASVLATMLGYKNDAADSATAAAGSATAAATSASSATDALANEAADFSSSKAYAIGDYVIYNNGTHKYLYRFTAAHSAGAWVGTDVTQVAIADDVSDLKSAIDVSNVDIDDMQDVLGMVTYEKLTGTIQSDKYIDGSGAITTANTWSVETVEASPSTYYRITARAYSGRYYFAFYDSSNVFINGLEQEESGTKTITDYIVKAPSNAKYLSVVFVESAQSLRKIEEHTTPTSTELITIENDVSDIKSALVASFEKLTGTTTADKYIDANGVVSSANNWTIETFTAVPLALYRIKAQAYNNRYYFAFYDSNNAFISGVKSENEGTTVLNNYEVQAPSTASTLVLVSITETPENRVAEKQDGYVSSGTWSGKKWVVFGDSITEENRRTNKHYFDYITDATGISTYNMGNSGSGYYNEKDLGTAFYQRISDVPTDADVITIFGSFNDLTHIAHLGTATDTTTDTIGGCINKTLDNLFEAFPLANVGIVSPTPWQGANPTNEPNNASAYVDLLKAICEKRGIPFLDLFHCSQLRPWEASYRLLAYSKDDGGGTHPDETGHKIIAPRFKGFLDTLLL